MDIKKKSITIEELLRVQNGTATSQEYLDAINASYTNEDIRELLSSDDTSDCNEDISLWNNLFDKYKDEIEIFASKEKIIQLNNSEDFELRVAAIKKTNKD